MCAVGVLELSSNSNNVQIHVQIWCLHLYPLGFTLTLTLTYVPRATNHQVSQIRDQEDKQAAQPSLIFHEILFYSPKSGPFL